MAFSSLAICPIPSPASSIDLAIASNYVAYSLFSRISPRNHFRASFAISLSKIWSASRVFGYRIAAVSGISMKSRLLFHARASKKEAELNSSIVDPRMAVASAVTVVLAVANRVLYKVALVPMKRYPFFLAQFTTFGYVAVYFSILYIRFHTGIVTKEMLEVPKSRFMAIGFLEALGVACGMSAGAMLPGPAIPILSQTFLVWQLVLSALVLGRKYSLNQLIGCLFVSAGVILAVTSGSSDGQLLSGTELLWPALMVTSAAFHAAASIIKEFVFIDSSKHLQGKSLDIFVVNSFGSAFQALFVFLLLPFLSNLKGIPISELPQYLYSGAACFLNIRSSIEGCEGAPFLPLLFILTNVAFNISLLSIVKMSSALLSSLVATLAVPLSIYILSLPLPYIPEGTDLNAYFVVGTSILVLGLALYNLPIGNKLHRSD